MHIKGLFKTWLYLGYDKETCLKHQAERNLSNLKTLWNMCIVLSSANAFAVLAAVFVVSDMKPVTYAMTFTASISFALVCRHLIHINYQNTRAISALVIIASLVSYAACMYTGLKDSYNDFSVTLIGFMLFVQVIFNISPIQNICTVIPTMLVFIFLTHRFKNLREADYDTIHIIVATAVGMFMSWNITKLKLENFIARDKLKIANEVLYYTSSTDSLTHLNNRQRIFEIYGETLANCTEKNIKAVCIVLDIDNFKSYNDTYGHPKGDELLSEIGRVLSEIQKIYSVHAGRIGGEEFIIICPGVDVARGICLADQIRLAIANLNIEHRTSNTAEVVTVSEGMCELIGDRENIPQVSYVYADRALYDAKTNGKNCCCIYNTETNSTYFIK